MKQIIILALIFFLGCKNDVKMKQKVNPEIDTVVLIIGKTLPEYSKEEVINLSAAIDPMVNKFDGYYGRKMLFADEQANLMGDIVFYRDVASFEKASEIEMQSETCKKFFATLDANPNTSKMLLSKPVFMTDEEQKEASVVEVVITKANPKFSKEEVANAAKALNPILETIDGFISRKLLVTEDAQWIDVLYWTDMEKAKNAFNTITENKTAQAYFNMADKATTEVYHFNVAIDTEKQF